MNTDHDTYPTFQITQGGALKAGLGRSFPLPHDFSPRGDHRFALIHVHHGLPRGTKLKLKPLYGGVEGAIISRLRGDTLLLLNDYDVIKVFAYDGSVQIIEFDVDDPWVRTLPPPDALQARLDSISDDMFRLAESDLESETRVKVEDKLLHQVADLLERAGTDTFMRKQVLAYCERTMSKMTVRGGVRRHFTDVLALQGDSSVYGWLFGVVDDEASATVIDFKTEKTRRGAPAHAEAKRNERRLRDQSIREKMRGSGEEKPLHPNTPKKKSST